jgi:hypothetical protein
LRLGGGARRPTGRSRWSPSCPGVQSEVINWQQVHCDQIPHLGLDAVVERGRPKSLEQPVGPLEMDPVAPMAPDVSERGGEEGLADPDEPECVSLIAGVSCLQSRNSQPHHLRPSVKAKSSGQCRSPLVVLIMRSEHRLLQSRTRVPVSDLHAVR